MKEHYVIKISRTLLAVVFVVVFVLITAFLWAWNNSQKTQEIPKKVATADHAETTEANEEHAEEGEIHLSPKQLVEQGIQLATVSTGAVASQLSLPGKLVINTDQQAHIAPNFNGHVEQVFVALGQRVEKGQILAILLVPELIDQQANLNVERSTLELARQDLQRERQLWQQGVSAKQDLQRAENAYQQAQIRLQSSQARLRALGATGTQGRFEIRSPMNGVISQKDIVVGENVQLADQLFVIEQLQNVWLEFNVPLQAASNLSKGEKIDFKLNGSDQVYSAIIQSLSAQADAQTGRLQVRAKVQQQADALRPNVLVNVLLKNNAAKTALRIRKTALQKIEGNDSIFVVDKESADEIHLKAQAVQLGTASADGQWLELISGLNAGQKYVAEGSFLLKSELEKDEAGHAH